MKIKYIYLLLLVCTVTIYAQSLKEEMRLQSLDEPRIALEASKLSGWYFKNIDKSYRDNKQFVLEVLKKDGISLQYVSKRLRADKEVVLTAVKNDAYSLEYADKILQKDRDICLACLSKKDFNLNHQNDMIKDDEELVLKAIKSKSDNFFSVSHRLKKDKNFLLKVLDIDPKLIKNFNARFYDDKELMRHAIKKDGAFLFYASQRLRSDKELIGIAVKNSKEALFYVYPRAKGVAVTEDKEYIERKFKKDVWKYYKAEDAIEAMYGKKVNIQKDKSHRFLRYQVNHGGHSQIRKLWLLKKMKSLALFQEVKGERSFIAFFLIADFIKNHYDLEIKVNEAKDIKLIFVSEYIDGRVEAIEHKMLGTFFCREGDSRLDFYDLIEKVRQDFISHYKSLSDIQINVEKSSHSKMIDIEIQHNMRGYNRAKKPDFLTYILVKYKSKIVLESYLSEYVSQNPRISFLLKDVNKGDVLEFELMDIHGYKVNKSVPIRFKK